MSSDGQEATPITYDLLRELGDWRASKEGRAIAVAGGVSDLDYTPPILSGTVKTIGGASFKARLKLGKGIFGIENLCSCRQAQRDGTICPHVVAIVHAWLERARKASTPVATTRIASALSAESTVSKPAAPKLGYAALEDAAQESQHLALAVVLPADLAKAWNGGQILVILKASLQDGAFKPLDAIQREPAKPYAVGDADERLLRAIEKLNGGGVPGMWQLRANDADVFFVALAGHPRVTLGTQKPLSILAAESRPKLFLSLESTGEAELRLADATTRAGQALGSWVFDGAVLERACPLPPAYRSLTTGTVRLSREEFARFYQREMAALEKLADLVTNDAFKKLEFSPRAPRIRVTVDGALAGVTVQLEAAYPDRSFALKGPLEQSSKPGADWSPDPAHPFRYWTRDFASEQRAQRELLAVGFEPSQRWPELYALTPENRVGAFLANVLPRWRAKWDVVFGERMTNVFARCDIVEPEVAITSSGEDWLAVDMSFKTSGGGPALTADEVRQLLAKGVSHQRLPNGRIALVPTESVQEFQEIIYDCQADQSGGRLKINRRFGAYLGEALREGGWAVAPRSNWQPPARIEAMREEPLPGELANILRPYQRIGVNWLAYLAQNGMAGVLADEMGLGKTLQMLAFLAARERQKPSLVVCPTSLVNNWAAEAARFTPGLKTLVLHGPKRQARFAEIGTHDLVVTSYALLRRDIEQYAPMEFDTVVLDEAQHIKNRFSQNAQAAKSLNGTHRFVLTGTPMENSLYDLWSIFDFLMPGYLGPATEFRDRYEVPIAKDSDEAALRRLRQRLRPFVLRRVKEEVAPELPPKLEQITFCEMSDEQKAVYQALLDQSRREVFEHAGKGGEAQRRMAVLTALTRLRQACCHLDLLPAVDGKQWREPSAKLEMCLELIEEAMDGGHRVLVFSQFVRLLQLIVTALREREIEFCYLDGSTVDRLGEVRRFQESPDIPLFLISLKAGGTGLNLTGADTVIHFDPWWNPAVEEQATARAHRIGQSRAVTSYKLIAQGSVEEKIVHLQERKKELIASTLTSDEAFTQSLTWDELQGLLE